MVFRTTRLRQGINMFMLISEVMSGHNPIEEIDSLAERLTDGGGDKFRRYWLLPDGDYETILRYGHHDNLAYRFFGMGRKEGTVDWNLQAFRAGWIRIFAYYDQTAQLGFEFMPAALKPDTMKLLSRLLLKTGRNFQQIGLDIIGPTGKPIQQQIFPNYQQAWQAIKGSSAPSQPAEVESPADTQLTVQQRAALRRSAQRLAARRATTPDIPTTTDRSREPR